jgi:hypothetical protein
MTVLMLESKGFDAVNGCFEGCMHGLVIVTVLMLESNEQ